jgi:transcriptional regulator with XRE-family HTH domain
MPVRHFDGRRVRAERRAAELTQRYVAQEVGVSVPAVVSWEAGKSAPDGEKLPALARALRMELDELFPRDGLPDLADLRCDAGYSQAATKEITKTRSAGPVAHAERAKRRLSEGFVQPLAATYGVSVEELLAAQERSFSNDPEPARRTGESAPAPDRPELPGTFAKRLDHLCKNDPRGPFSDAQIAAILQEAKLPPVSDTYVEQLRTGRRDNPTKHHIEGFAKLFGVPVKYFFEDDTAQVVNTLLGMVNGLKAKGVTTEQLHTQLESLSRLLESGLTAEQVITQLETLNRLNRAGVTLDALNHFNDAGVTNIAMRAVGLSGQGLSAAAAMLDQVRRLEGLPTEPDQDQS